MKKSVGILIFDSVEVLDFCGPFEVFSVTRLNEDERLSTTSPFDVKIIAPTKDIVKTTGNMKIVPDFDYESTPKLDILLVAGGMGTRKLMYDENMLNFVKSMANKVELLASVCTGSLILANAKLLENKSATTHFKSLDRLKDEFKNVNVSYSKNFVEDGNIISSAGISAGIDMALYIVGKYFGKDIARNTAKHMEYIYHEENIRKIEF